MKIVFIASYPPSLLNFRIDLMKAFISKGFEVSAIAPQDETVALELRQYNIPLIPVEMQRNGLNPIADLKLIVQLIKILKKERATSIFAYTIKPVIYGSIAAKFAGVPHIYSMITGTGYVFLDHNLKSRVVGLIARTLFKCALFFNKLVFFQNQDNRVFFKMKKIISHKKKTAVINGSGVNCEQFTPVSYPLKLSFLMIARFLYDKGVREFVQAAQQLKPHYPHVEFKMVGWIDTNPNSVTENELNEWVQEGSIVYLGRLSDVRPAIADSSVYVLPSYHEGTPRTVLEAMAMARPIITTDAPGCKETVKPNINGFLVPTKNSKNLAEAMEFFIKNPEKIHQMGAESRKIALEKYDVNKVNNHILQEIEFSMA